MSAILAILLMLMGGVGVFAPRASAQAPAAYVTCNLYTKTGIGVPITPNVTLPSSVGYGDVFNVSIDVGPVVGLLTYQVGFYFNASILQVLNVWTYHVGGVPNVFNSVAAAHTSQIPASINNNESLPGGGYVNATLNSVLGPSYAQTVTTNATLAVVQFELNGSALNPHSWPPTYNSINFAQMIGLSTVSGDPREIILTYKDGVTDITPYGYIYSGYFTLSIPMPVSHGPTAVKSYSPKLPNGDVYVGAVETFDGSASTGGFNAITNTHYPLKYWNWTFGDTPLVGPVNATTIKHTFTSPNPDVTVTLTVEDTDGQIASDVESITVIAVPTGCSINLFTQSWRYIDPVTFSISPFTGTANTTAAPFRPGDYVHLYADVTYNSAPVAGQLVSFQVNQTAPYWGPDPISPGPANTVLLVGTAISNATGIAEYDFRVPWPDTPYYNVGTEGANGTEFLPEFGIWEAMATWQCGVPGNATGPNEKTQMAFINFEVSWGIWVTGVMTTQASYVRGPATTATVKLTIQNDYPVAVQALATADIYDTLTVPIDAPAYSFQYFPTGITVITVGPITIENWAFVGIATVKANLFSTWPWPTAGYEAGTSFCPEVVNTFTIAV